MSAGGPLAILLLTALPVLAVGPGERCLPCHQQQVSDFRKTGMGRSVNERPNALDGTFFHRLSNRHYKVQNGVMSRHQLNAEGAPVNVVEKRIDLSIGSGNHAVTYLHRTPAGRLLELPLSRYARRNGYSMSPGYDQPDHFDFRREISDNCLFCHSAAKQPAPIDCARCHGDTEAHAAAPSRRNILNPARLSPRAQLEICLQCHLETESRAFPDSLLRPERAAFAYKPGEPLQSYKLYFDRADGAADDRFEINHAGYRLLESACFRKSDLAVTCTTCHDPHSARVRQNACRQCHAAAHEPERRDCESCHMPKRTPSDAIHTVMTDHKIQRKPVFTNPTRESQASYLGPLADFYTISDPLTRAIINIRQPSESAVGLYREYLRQHPAHVPSLAALGNTLLRLNRPKDAEPVLAAAVKVDPRHIEATNNLGVAYAMQGNYAKARDILVSARDSHPDHASTWVNLGQVFEALGDRPQAAAAYQEAIRLQPDSSEARMRLQTLRGAR